MRIKLQNGWIDLPVERVRINRCTLYEKRTFPDGVFWEKTEGGTGYVYVPLKITVDTHELLMTIYRRMRKSEYNAKTREYDSLYHLWYKEGTLNVTMNKLH